MCQLSLDRGRVRERDADAGIVIVGSVPPRPGGGEPATLSATSTAMAPAFCRFFTLVLNVQVPRSTSPMLFRTARALSALNGVHAKPVPLAWSMIGIT